MRSGRWCVSRCPCRDEQNVPPLPQPHGNYALPAETCESYPVRQRLLTTTNAHSQGQILPRAAGIRPYRRATSREPRIRRRECGAPTGRLPKRHLHEAPSRSLRRRRSRRAASSRRRRLPHVVRPVFGDGSTGSADQGEPECSRLPLDQSGGTSAAGIHPGHRMRAWSRSGFPCGPSRVRFTATPSA